MRLPLAILFAAALAACSSSSVDVQRTAPSQTAVGGSRAVAVSAPRFGDYKPHPWDSRAPYSHQVHGVDVSRWQGDVNWPVARQSGVAFAFIKATEGGDVADPMFLKNWINTARAGVARGAYHYYYFCRSAEEQARWFIANVPRDPNALPPVLDLEWTHTSKTCPWRPDGGHIQSEAKKYLDILERHYGQRPVIYTTVDFYRETGIGSLKNTEFWLRSVAGHPVEVYPGAEWTFWQYTGTGQVPGIDGPVDLNVYRGSTSSWKRWRS